VAKWNELRSLFGRLNSGDPRRGKNISLRNSVFRNEIDRLRLESNLSSRYRGARAQRLGRNIHHLGPAIPGDVSQTFHDSATDCDHLAVRLIVVAKVMLLRLSIDHIEKELLQLLIARARA
jgi:hypothetical protein